jgi:hypothetical protein
VFRPLFIPQILFDFSQIIIWNQHRKEIVLVFWRLYSLFVSALTLLKKGSYLLLRLGVLVLSDFILAIIGKGFPLFWIDDGLFFRGNFKSKFIFWLLGVFGELIRVESIEKDFVRVSCDMEFHNIIRGIDKFENIE